MKKIAKRTRVPCGERGQIVPAGAMSNSSASCANALSICVP
jgi:hypothetical protein